MLEEMKKLFEISNAKFLKSESDLIKRGLSERSLCASLMCFLREAMKDTVYSDYFVDAEYNRNGVKVKTIINGESKVVDICCDVIVHSRGNNVQQDNLIALEMKKSYRDSEAKEKDIDRLKCLTKKSLGDTWPVEGDVLPEHVCGYVLGIYYELNAKANTIDIRYFSGGDQMSQYHLAIA